MFVPGELYVLASISGLNKKLYKFVTVVEGRDVSPFYNFASTLFYV